MSNKTTLQSNNALISQNNTDLQALINTANALPDAGGGGGGSVETCDATIFITDNVANTSGTRVGVILYTTLENGKAVSHYVNPVGIDFSNVIVGSILYVEGNSSPQVTNGVVISHNISTAAYFITPTGGQLTVKFISAKPCFVRGTLISLANGDSKNIEDITYEDELLVWDFDNGRYSSAKPIWIKREQVSNYYYHCLFENGIELKLVGSNGKCHRIFSVDDNKFLSATDCIGKMVMTERGASKLISCKRVDEDVEFYNVITEYHLNLFANSVLSSCRLNNLYPIENMKFIKENRDVIFIDEYKEHCSTFYDGLRLDERKREDIVWINDYISNLNATIKDA